MSTKRTKAIFGVSAFVALGVIGALYVRRLESEGGDLRVRSPAPAAEPSPRRAASPEPTTPRKSEPAPVAHAPSKGPQGDRERVQDWLSKARDYQADDRASVLDAALDALRKTPIDSVLELERELSELSVYDQTERAAAFHALEKLGKELADSKDPRAKEALDAIQRVAKTELELPSMIEPSPDVDVDALSEPARDELLHRGILVEENGELLQPTTLNKLPVIRMLTSVGGPDSLAKLKKLAETQDNPVGVKFAVDQAIAVASR